MAVTIWPPFMRLDVQPGDLVRPKGTTDYPMEVISVRKGATAGFDLECRTTYQGGSMSDQWYEAAHMELVERDGARAPK